MTEHIEDDAASYSHFYQQDNKAPSSDVVQQDNEASSSDVSPKYDENNIMMVYKNMWIEEIDSQSIFHN